MLPLEAQTVPFRGVQCDLGYQIRQAQPLPRMQLSKGCAYANFLVPDVRVGRQRMPNPQFKRAMLLRFPGKVPGAAFPCAGTVLGVERVVLALNVKWWDS